MSTTKTTHTLGRLTTEAGNGGVVRIVTVDKIDTGAFDAITGARLPAERQIIARVNAKHALPIVRACNSHDDLLKACDAAREAILAILNDEQTREAGLWQGEFLPRLLRQIESAIAKAEGSES